MSSAHQHLDETLRTAITSARQQLNQVILGKDEVICLALACVVADGHLLIEDVPGVGKTTLAQALARSLGLSYQRIQFTSDLLPADIIGVSLFDQASSAFRFKQGPIFTQLVLADEINRASPKAQSALLEAMEERHVTVDGETQPLPDPFYVIATQNPSWQMGTYALPESQLDRFLMRVKLGYPDAEHERQLLSTGDQRRTLATLPRTIDPGQLRALQRHAETVHASAALLDYVQAIVGYTRTCGRFSTGLSPRAGLALLRAARAWSVLQDHPVVLPEAVQAVLPSVVGHRLTLAHNGDNASGLDIGLHVLTAVPVP